MHYSLLTKRFQQLPKKMSEFFCGPCSIQLNSKFQWDQHLIGGKHMRAAALTQSIPVDMSLAVVMPDGNYKCKTCNDFVCSGLIPFQQHVIGQKHMKNIQRALESSTRTSSTFSENKSLQSSPSSTLLMRKGSLPDTATDASLAVAQSDGSYKCKICVDFTCSGRIPMQDHLKGKSHLKNFRRNPTVENLSVENLNISTPTRKVYPIPSALTVEERVAKAWNHQTICGYSYDEFFPKLSVEEKIEALNPHFAFIGKDDPMPNFIKYLNII